MQIVAALGGGSFLLICIVGGVRLLMLARRTRQLPELVLGLGLFLMGGVGTPAGALARSPLEISEFGRTALILLQGVIMAIGYGGFALFTWKVFRPNARWARTFAWGVPVCALSGLAAMMMEPNGMFAVLNVGEGTSAGYLVQQLVGLTALSWTAFEALGHYSALRRRVRVGLADPVVTDRIRLWGGAMAIASAMAAMTTISQLMGVDPMTSSAGTSLIAGFGLVAATGIYLAFLPPQFYTNWVSSRAMAAG